MSQREKRQQRRKDKGGDESGSPGRTESSANATNAEHTATVEEPNIIATPSVTSKTSNTKSSTKNTKTTSTPGAKAQKNGQRTQQAAPPGERKRSWSSECSRSLLGAQSRVVLTEP